MRGLLSFCAVAALAVAGSTAMAEDKPIVIGADSPIQLEVGRDTVDALQMGIDEINAKGGVLGRKLQLVVADETMDPQQGVAAIKKLTSEEHVDVLIGGYNSGVTLAEEPHIADAKTIYLGIGSASPTITDFVGKNYKRFKYIFRVSPPNSALQAQFLVSFATEKVRGDLGAEKIAIVGENAVWVQGLVPVLKAGIEKAGMQVPLLELFDPDMSDFSPLLAKVKDSGAQYMLIVLSHANTDVFVKQWYDAKFPIPMGGIDVKSQDPDFFKRIGGKSISEVVTNGIIPDAITPRTLPFWNAFVEKYHRSPVYTAPGAYDALQIYVEAVERAKSTDPEKVIPELEKTAYVGTQGQYVFDKNHDVESGPGKINTLFVQWQEGGARVVVWPKDVSKGKMILPPWINQRAEAK